MTDDRYSQENQSNAGLVIGARDKLAGVVLVESDHCPGRRRTPSGTCECDATSYVQAYFYGYDNPELAKDVDAFLWPC